MLSNMTVSVNPDKSKSFEQEIESWKVDTSSLDNDLTYYHHLLGNQRKKFIDLPLIKVAEANSVIAIK